MIGRWERQHRDYQASDAYEALVKERRGSHEWTADECRAFDGLLFGCEQELAYWDAIAREAITWCTVCDGVFHQNDLEPCGPADAACPDCRATWAIMTESEETDVSE